MRFFISGQDGLRKGKGEERTKWKIEISAATLCAEAIWNALTELHAAD